MQGESFGELRPAWPSSDPGRAQLADVRLTGRPSGSLDGESLAALHTSLDSLVLLIEQRVPGMRGSILLLDDDRITLRHGSAPHLPMEYCRAIDGAHIGPSAGSCGTAAFRRERVIVRDIGTDPLWADYRALALPHGLRACWSTPILDARGGVLGTFAMYYDEPRLPSDDEVALTGTAALLACNIIIRARAESALRASERELREQAQRLALLNEELITANEHLHERTEAAERGARSLAQSEARMRVLSEAIPVQVWTATPDGQLDFVADKVAHNIGRPSAELLGSGWASAVHPDDLDRAAALWRNAIDSGEPYEAEFRVFSAGTGEYRWHLVRALPLYDENGTILRWYGTNTDIEEQKRAEAARDAARAEAERANRAKSAFLAMMSHELRTPLNAIGGYATLMLEGIPTPASEGQQNYLRRILKGQQHLLEVINAVLTHAKLEAGRMTYRMSSLRMSELLDAVETLIGPQRAAREITYDANGADPALVVRGDREKVVQILVNLLSNAVKFTPPGGQITVTTEVPSPDRALIRVRDTGVGMTAEQAATVFEPFVQFDNRLSSESKGTGLGMPISRELARGMGGDLTVESEPGVGTEFLLTLST